MPPDIYKVHIKCGILGKPLLATSEKEVPRIRYITLRPELRKVHRPPTASYKLSETFRLPPALNGDGKNNTGVKIHDNGRNSATRFLSVFPDSAVHSIDVGKVKTFEGLIQILILVNMLIIIATVLFYL